MGYNGMGYTPSLLTAKVWPDAMSYRSIVAILHSIPIDCQRVTFSNIHLLYTSVNTEG